MADHYQDRPFPTDAEHDRGAVRDESSLLAKLAQLTGQSDPFGTAAKTPLPLQSRANVRPQLPPWMQKRARPLGRRHGCSAPGRNTKSRSIPEPRASCAPLRSRVSRSVRTGPSRATSRGRAVWPDQIRRAGKYSLSGRSLRPSTRLRRRAGAAHSQRWDGDRCSGAGTGRGGDGGCLGLSNLCWLSAQRRAADHHSRQQRDQGGADPV